MVLYTGKSILDIANQNNFAIPAFNISDWAMFLGVMDVSEEKNAPVIIAIHPDEVSHVTTDLIVAIRERDQRLGTAAIDAEHQRARHAASPAGSAMIASTPSSTSRRRHSAESPPSVTTRPALASGATFHVESVPYFEESATT